MEQQDVAKIVSENIKTIFAYALSRVSNKNVAEDLASEIVVAILSSAPKLRDNDAFYGFIWAIAANTYKKFLSSKKKAMTDTIEHYPELSTEDTITDDIIQNEEINLLRRELSLLSREYRECTVAYYIDGMSCAEVSAKLEISLEMVKYYLFKTRKILKEGFGMTREYGEKSYNPGKFYFQTIFAEKANWEYTRLFNRKLPGNILLSAYYTPMTIREMSIELGVSSVYLEDEIKLLESYNLIKKITENKVQSNLVILTEAYKKEWLQQIKKTCESKLKSILDKLDKLLPEVRKIDFYGNDFDETRLKWALFVASIFNAWDRSKEYIKEKVGEYPEIYRGTHGIIYGLDYDDKDEETGCCGFAGSTNVGNYPYCTYVNFNVLGEHTIKNSHVLNDAINSAVYTGSDDQKKLIEEKISVVKNGQLVANFPVFRKLQFEKAKIILEPVIIEIKDLCIGLAQITTDIMQTHAPKALSEQAEKIAYYNLMFELMGTFGLEAVSSGGLKIPKTDEKLAVFGVSE